MCPERGLFAHFIQLCCVFCKIFLHFHENLVNFENSVQGNQRKLDDFTKTKQIYLRSNLSVNPWCSTIAVTPNKIIMNFADKSYK
jgi:hypothetical protein